MPYQELEINKNDEAASFISRITNQQMAYQEWLFNKCHIKNYTEGL